MKKNEDKIITLITLVVMLAAIYGLIVAGRWLIIGLIGLDEKRSSVIIAACTTVIVSVITVVYTQQKVKTREIDNSHRPEKMKIYKKFMDEAIVGLLKASKEKKIDSPEFQNEMEKVFISFTGEIIVWGSPAVIRAYSVFRSAGSDPQIVLLLDDLLKVMREDLGNSNSGLLRGELIKLFISDPEKLDEVMDTISE